MDGHVYYSLGLAQYELDTETDTWVEKTWNGLTKFNGRNVWMFENHVFYSSNFEYDVATDTWHSVTFDGLKNFGSSFIWKLDNHIYYTYEDNTYELT